MDMAIPSAAMALAQEAARDATERARRVMSASDEQSRKWYVVHNAAGNDKRALETLRRCAFEVYYPAEATMKVVPRNKLSQKQRRSMIPVYTRVLNPFFPRYFFVRFNLARGDWHDIFGLAGIHGILFTDDSPRPLPAPISDQVVAKIKSWEVDGAIPATIEASKFAYEVGEEVRITAGPLAQFTGVVERLPEGSIETLDESARLRLLVSLFGRKSVVEMALADIEKL
jgi:transcription termination/antitermination protein NusG